ncbi:hypothetical protein AB3S75_023224 [Citrus x aurantiifolia]
MFTSPKMRDQNLMIKPRNAFFLGYGHEEFRYKLWELLAKKLIRSRDVVFLEDQIVSDAEKSDESQSSLEIPIIPTSVSPPVAHDDHGGTGEDNNDSPGEPIGQAPLEPPTPLVEPELRRSTRERQPSTR